MKRIPLRTRDGSIVAWTTVDDSDCEFLSQWRWYLNIRGYAARGQKVGLNSKCIKMHRVIAKRAGLDVSETIDHVNRNKLDNRRSNLREASQREQVYNASMQKNNVSGFVGVHFNKSKRKWQSQIGFDSTRRHLGYFDTPLEAGLVRALHAIVHHGQFASHVGDVIELTEEVRA